MIVYKEFTAELLADVQKLYERAGWKAYLGDSERLKRTFEQSLHVLGAFEDMQLIGFIRCVGDGEHIVYVQDLIVDLDYKRQGIGTELLHKVMEKYADVRMFTLVTDSGDNGSNAFYRSVGMKTYDECNLAAYLR